MQSLSSDPILDYMNRALRGQDGIVSGLLDRQSESLGHRDIKRYCVVGRNDNFGGEMKRPASNDKKIRVLNQKDKRARAARLRARMSWSES